MRTEIRGTVTFLAVFTFIHALVSTGTYLWSIKRSMEVAYLGEPHTWLDSALQLSSNLLLSPIFALLFHLRGELLHGGGEFLAVLANSFLWALAVRWIITRARRRRGAPGV